MILTSEQVTNIAEVLDLEFEAIYWDYSGRGMYGKRCIGFTFASIDDIWSKLLNVNMKEELVKWWGWEPYDADQVTDALMSPSYDAMAYDVILYFPRVSVDKVPEEVLEDNYY